MGTVLGQRCSVPEDTRSAIQFGMTTISQPHIRGQHSRHRRQGDLGFHDSGDPCRVQSRPASPLIPSRGKTWLPDQNETPIRTWIQRPGSNKVLDIYGCQHAPTVSKEVRSV
jgi:hypothetical protein